MTEPPFETFANAQAARSRRPIRMVFRATAFIEAFTWAGLLIAMIVKYALQGNPMGVTVFGWLHGTAWIAFIAAGITAAIRFRWPIQAVLLGVLSSLLPFMTIPFDIWMERTGRLSQQATRANARPRPRHKERSQG